MQIRALTLDVGHTLLFPHPSLGEVYVRVGRRHGLTFGPDVVAPLFASHWKRCQEQEDGLIYGTNQAEALAFWCKVNRGIFLDCGLPATNLETFVHDLYTTFGHAECWRVNPDLDELLHQCRRRKIAVGIISNWDVRLRSLLDQVGFTAWADPVLISAEQKVEKPNPLLFRRAATHLGLSPAEILHVGDTWSDDVAAARACGMQAAWFNPEGTPPPESLDGIVTIRRLCDLLPCLPSPD